MKPSLEHGMTYEATDTPGLLRGLVMDLNSIRECGAHKKEVRNRQKVQEHEKNIQ